MNFTPTSQNKPLKSPPRLGLNGPVYDFNVDCGSIAVDHILDIHNYLMKKNDIVENVWVYEANICFILTMMFFSYSLLNRNSLKCVSVNNQECKVRPEKININSNEPSFYPYSVNINKCSGSCNNINDPYAKKFHSI